MRLNGWYMSFHMTFIALCALFCLNKWSVYQQDFCKLISNFILFPKNGI